MKIAASALTFAAMVVGVVFLARTAPSFAATEPAHRRHPRPNSRKTKASDPDGRVDAKRRASVPLHLEHPLTVGQSECRRDEHRGRHHERTYCQIATITVAAPVRPAAK